MGYPVVAIDADLAKIWRKVLEEKGLSVRLDELEARKLDTESASKRVTVPWRVGDRDVELPIIEATSPDRDDGVVQLIFMLETGAQKQLFLLVQKTLVAAGATAGPKPKPAKKTGPS